MYILPILSCYYCSYYSFFLDITFDCELMLGACLMYYRVRGINCFRGIPILRWETWSTELHMVIDKAKSINDI